MIKITTRWQIIRQLSPSLKACRTNCAEHITHGAIVVARPYSLDRVIKRRGAAMAMRQLGREFRASYVNLCPKYACSS